MTNSSREFWTTLVEQDRELAADEFPHRASLAEINRRDLLKFMGASLALAGLAGCRTAFLPQRKLVPYVDPPETNPGEFAYFRTATVRHGYAFGLHVATREGRPIKVEGNPEHPASLGACDPVSMAETLTFYDPDRARSVHRRQRDASWSDFLAAFHEVLVESRGEGVCVLTGATTSPTLNRQFAALEAAYPGVRRFVHEPLDRRPVYEGVADVFGQPFTPIYHLDRAKVIVLVDYAFDRAELGAYRYAGEMIAGRSDGRTNRIYAVYTMPGPAAGFADHARPMAPAEIRRFLADLASGSSDDPWTRAVIADLRSATGSALVLPGESLSRAEYAACAAINSQLTAPVDYVSPPTAASPNLRDLVGEMSADRVRALLVSSTNPLYSGPADVDFAGVLARVPFTAYHGLYEDETAIACEWRLPATHSFEHWTDAFAFDGTATIAQPLIEPLFNGRSLHQLLAALAGDERPDLEIIRDTWRAHFGADFQPGWREAVRRGVVAGTEPKPLLVTPKLNPSFDSLRSSAAGFEISIRPDPYLGDGSRANNGWLQELPRPVTGITWDLPIHVSPRTAEQMKLENGDHVRVGSVVGSVWITPSHADGAATMYLGQGRRTGAVANGVGFNAYTLTTDATPFVADFALERVEGNTEVATIQRFTGFAGRDVIHEFDFGQVPGSADLAEGPTLYELTEQMSKELPRPQWGMSIDLNRCIGCGACVAACVAENNTPVVGKDQVIVGRHMHWIRVDAYHSGPRDDPRTFFQPLPCMHCETAPCEPVCPVAATVHSHEGLNQMIYNRCVGTRYCSNNCPYKVRRFNFLDYQTEQPNYRGRDMDLLRLLNNPDVTVRSRGVMEKCSYCVQRINHARIKAKEELRDIADGEVVTACQQACPTSAIVFGDLADRASQAHKLREDARTYALLKDLNTRPRTTYLAKLRNPNPAIPESPNSAKEDPNA